MQGEGVEEVIKYVGENMGKPIEGRDSDED